MSTFIAIDLKSFYASAECVKRGKDPLDTNLVVADKSRTEKTICLAVSPSLKAYGLPGRARLFEVVEKVKEINHERLKNAPGHKFVGKSTSANELKNHPEYALDFIIAPPAMKHYLKQSSIIYGTYLNYIAAEDIHVYSVDEVFMDVTSYLKTYHLSAHDLAIKMIRDILKKTGITATAGIGPNLYLAKVAMDIVAKHLPADKDGVRIAELDEISYREKLWEHVPITDFWRVGTGYARRLKNLGIKTMGDVALYSTSDLGRDKLYATFGVNAELLIDHAWGIEPCTMKDIKNYSSARKSLGSGQVLSCPYDFKKSRIIVAEMADALALDLTEKNLVSSQIVLDITFDPESLNQNKTYSGPVELDRYGRKIPYHAHGTINLETPSTSSRELIKSATELFDQITNKSFLVRRVGISATKLQTLDELKSSKTPKQLNLFDILDPKKQETAEKASRLEAAELKIKQKYGKNAILRGLNFEDGATMKNRNQQIGGHKA